MKMERGTTPKVAETLTQAPTDLAKTFRTHCSSYLIRTQNIFLFTNLGKNIFIAGIMTKVFASRQFQRVGREGETFNILFLALKVDMTRGNGI